MKPFSPPTWLMVSDYAKSIGFPDMDIDKFLNHHGMRGWKLNYGGKLFPMQSWKRAVISWKHNHERYLAAQAVQAQAVVDAEAIRRRLLAGERVRYAEKCKLTLDWQYKLSPVDENNPAGLWFLPGEGKN
jgi:hypothetical protein